MNTSGRNIIRSIADKGKGFDRSTGKNGIGLENIRRRTEFMNGSLDIDSSLGKGTRLTVQVPLGQAG